MIALLFLACGDSAPEAVPAVLPQASTAPEPAPEPEAPAPVASDTRGCSPGEALELDATGVCDATFRSWDEGDFFYVGLEAPDARFTCGPCADCEGIEVGTPVRVHWKVQSIEIPEGSTASLHALVERCEPR